MKYVFIDRDGVINRDSPDYIKNCDEFIFLPRSLEAFRKLKAEGIEPIVITNQSVINRKMVTPDGLDAIFDKMKNGVLNSGGEIRDIFFCPHAPVDNCDCRKPKPGLIDQACSKHDIDPSKTGMIGDSAKDVEAAINAGCCFSVLVKTGNGEKSFKDLEEKGIKPDYFADDLYDAVCWVAEKYKEE